MLFRSGYRFRYGDLCINKNTIKLSEVKKEPESTKKTKVQNASAEPIRLKIWGASDTFRFSLLPDTLQPGEEGYLIIKYNPEKDTGIQTEYIYEIKQINSVGEKYIFDFKIISDK